MARQAGGKEEQGNLEIKVKGFERMLLQRFEEHYDSGMYTPGYHLLDYMVEDI